MHVSCLPRLMYLTAGSAQPVRVPGRVPGRHEGLLTGSWQRTCRVSTAQSRAVQRLAPPWQSHMCGLLWGCRDMSALVCISAAQQFPGRNRPYQLCARSAGTGRRGGAAAVCSAGQRDAAKQASSSVAFAAGQECTIHRCMRPRKEVALLHCAPAAKRPWQLHMPDVCLCMIAAECVVSAAATALSRCWCRGCSSALVLNNIYCTIASASELASVCDSIGSSAGL